VPQGRLLLAILGRRLQTLQGNAGQGRRHRPISVLLSYDLDEEDLRDGRELSWENDYYNVQPFMSTVEKFMGDGDNPDTCTEVLKFGLGFRCANGRVYLNMRGRRLQTKIVIGRR